MKNIILLAQTQQDIAALATASREIKKLNTEGVWLVFSPAVLVDTAAAAKEHDVAIRDINEAMKACADRLDFEGAKNYKLKLDAAILDKAESVKNAYKKMTAAEQESAFQRVFGDFVKNPPAANMKVTQHSDHYEPESWIEFLNSLKGAWFAPFTPGTFSILWPTSLPETKSGTVVPKAEKAVVPTKLDPAPAPVVAAAPAPVFYEAPAPAALAPAAAPTPPPTHPALPAPGVRPKGIAPQMTPEFKQIMAMGLDGVAAEAFKIGINPNGKSLRKLVHMVYDAKYPKLS
jgi:hypothetical protein